MDKKDASPSWSKLTNDNGNILKNDKFNDAGGIRPVFLRRCIGGLNYCTTGEAFIILGGEGDRASIVTLDIYITFTSAVITAVFEKLL